MTLAATAEGRIPAETVIRDARLVNVCTGEIQEHTDVAIAQGRIALVGGWLPLHRAGHPGDRG